MPTDGLRFLTTTDHFLLLKANLNKKITVSSKEQSQERGPAKNHCTVITKMLESLSTNHRTRIPMGPIRSHPVQEAYGRNFGSVCPRNLTRSSCTESERSQVLIKTKYSSKLFHAGDACSRFRPLNGIQIQTQEDDSSFGSDDNFLLWLGSWAEPDFGSHENIRAAVNKEWDELSSLHLKALSNPRLQPTEPRKVGTQPHLERGAC